MNSSRTKWTSRLRWGAITGVLGLLFCAGCATAPTPDAPELAWPVGRQAPMLHEDVAPEGTFREHRLARCRTEEAVPGVVEKYLGTASEFFRSGSGSDGMIEMELGLREGHRHPLLLMTLGQLYLMAGQGDPGLLPVEGPAADVGSYERNKPRLLGRAQELLAEAQAARPDDAALDYLMADVARARGATARADSLVRSGRAKCTGGRSFRILRMYQQLYEYPPKYLGGPAPDFPQVAVDRGVGGDVVLDLLISPAGEVRQFAVVGSPDESLTAAASRSLRRGHFEAGRVGKYAVWSWLRVTTSFNLSP